LGSRGSRCHARKVSGWLLPVERKSTGPEGGGGKDEGQTQGKIRLDSGVSIANSSSAMKPRQCEGGDGGLRLWAAKGFRGTCVVGTLCLHPHRGSPGAQQALASSDRCVSPWKAGQMSMAAFPLCL